MAPVSERDARVFAPHDDHRSDRDDDREDTETDAAAEPSSEADPDARTISLAPEDVQAMIALILKKLDDDQAQDVVVIDLKDKSPLADAIVVVSGRSQRHVSSMADHLLRSLKDGGFGKAQVEGLPQADWVLIDAGDVIVHLFRPEVRAFYNLEKIWSVEPPRRLGGGPGHIPSLQAT
jgi:ribosome-associated protein